MLIAVVSTDPNTSKGTLTMAIQNFPRYSLIVLLGILAMPAVMQAAPKLGLENTDDFTWVHRRAPKKGSNDDPDDSGAFAVVLKLNETKNSKELNGKIWRYTNSKKKMGKEYYIGRQTSIDITGTPDTPKGDGKRLRRTLTLKDSAGKVVGYVSLFQGRKIKTNKPQDQRDYQRFIFRWNKEYADTLAGSVSKRRANCDEPPEDDPMEEEPFIPDPDNTTEPLPELPVDP